MNTPNWLVEKINTSRRAATPTVCRCGAETLTGDDHDTTAAVAHTDTTPTDPVTEVAGLLDGRQSYDLIRGALHIRQPWHHHNPTRPHPVLLEHRCPPEPKEGLW